MVSVELTERWNSWRQRVDACLQHHLPPGGINPASLPNAMRYVALAAGKRFRAALVYATGEMLGATDSNLDVPACAVELIHAFSLVHDDLPAMDNDNLRRGKPSCHIAFGEATAILVGDALQSLAFDLLATELGGLIPKSRLEMVRILAQASGVSGMAGGQAVDLSAAGTSMSSIQLEKMHRMKTGALIVASVQLGAQAAGACDADLVDGLTRYAQALGLVYQVTDDILDDTSDTVTLGKIRGADRKQNKPTYLTVFGEDDARDVASRYHREAISALANLNCDTGCLEALAHFVTKRHH